VNVPVQKLVAPANLTVETLQDLSRLPDLIRRSDESNLVTTGASIDAQLLLDDPQGPVSLTEEG
jgi:hypothetical protein